MIVRGGGGGGGGGGCRGSQGRGVSTLPPWVGTAGQGEGARANGARERRFRVLLNTRPRNFCPRISSISGGRDLARARFSARDPLPRRSAFLVSPASFRRFGPDLRPGYTIAANFSGRHIYIYIYIYICVCVCVCVCVYICIYARGPDSCYLPGSRRVPARSLFHFSRLPVFQGRIMMAASKIQEAPLAFLPLRMRERKSAIPFHAITIVSLSAFRPLPVMLISSAVIPRPLLLFHAGLLKLYQLL
jgi:hypothetical protein